MEHHKHTRSKQRFVNHQNSPQITIMTTMIRTPQPQRQRKVSFSLCRWISLLLVSCSLKIPQVSAARARVVVVGETQWAYPGEIAAFGNRLSRKTYDARLVLPPKEHDSKYLCSLKDAHHLQKSLVMDDNVFEEQPIALLVSRGECPFDQKAKNALYLQRTLSDKIMYLFVYNNDENAPTDLVIMSSSSEEDNLSDEYNSMGLIFLSTASGKSILERMENVEIQTGNSPYYSEEGNQNWDMYTYFERMQPAGGDGDTDDKWNSRTSTSSMGGNTFYWLRFILFALLIISPCFRAGYLWYVGGGRLHWRRNDDGRITGIMYVRPQPYWFASGPEHQAEREVSDCLTEEQVNALPEIIFKKQQEKDDEDEDDNTVENNKNNDSDGTPKTEEEEDIVIDLDEEQPPISTQPHGGISQELAGDDDDDNASRSITCTTCSICIDDFEDGEKLRLLPRCKHVFHTECIMPWLTERQGCCPLCKTGVLVDNNNDDDTEVEEQQEDTAISSGATSSSSSPSPVVTQVPTPQV